MRSSYFLPPKELLFKMLDKDINLIVNNYGLTRTEEWKDIYRYSIDRDSSCCPRDTALNSQIEKPRCVPDSTVDSVFLKKKLRLSRNRSLGIKRRRSSVGRKLDVSAYRLY